MARDLCCERLGSAPGALDRGGVLRYASIGAGLLLSDAEVLGALIRDGFELRSACVVLLAALVDGGRRQLRPGCFFAPTKWTEAPCVSPCTGDVGGTFGTLGHGRA